MRAAALLSGAALSAAVLAACDGGATEPPFLSEESPTPTATATPTAEPTVVATPAAVLASTVSPEAPTTASGSASMGEFRTFADLIDKALADGDGAFFAIRGIQTEVTCAGDEQLGFCMGQPPGTVFRGIPGVVWMSDAFWLSPPDEYVAMLQEWIATARPDLSDDYGDGAVRLFALARSSGGDADEEFLAIATVIRYTGPATEIQRQARIFRFVRGKDSWALRGERFAAVSFTSSDWLTGDCAECFDHWERWEGTP